MANQGSVINLKTNSIDQKVTSNGNGENTGIRVNGCLQDIVDTLTSSPVVSNGAANPASVFASAAQGLLADSAVQPTDLAQVATTGAYADLSSYVITDGVTLGGNGTAGNPLIAIQSAVAASGNYNDLTTYAAADGVTITGDGTTGNPFTVASSPVNIPVGNVTFVDVVNGNDATGVVGRLDKPFQSLLAAQTASASGTTIFVYPGTYLSGALGKDGVNWYFMPGCTVDFSGGNNGFVGGNTTYKVRGHANIINSDFTGRAVFSGNSAANIDIECDSISAIRLSFSLGTARVKANRITFTGATGGIAAFGGTATVIGDISSSTVNRLVDHTGGCTLRIINSKMTITTAAAPALQLTSGDWVSLENVIIDSAGDPITSFAGSTVRCLNVQANQAIGANVTIIGNLQSDYTTGGTVGQVATVNADGSWSWA